MRSRGPVRPPLLGELETAVMERLWLDGEGDAKSLHAVLGRRRGITLNTVQSTVKRLFEKGLLARDKVSHAHVYRPRVSREEFHRDVIANVGEHLLRAEGDALLSAFVDVADRAGNGALERMEHLVAERLRERARRPKGER